MLCLGCVAPLAAFALAKDAADTWVFGKTVPSEHAQSIRFTQSGVVAEVAVKPGDVVRAGQKLIALDTRQEQKELEIMALDASDIPITAAQKELEFKQAQFKRKDDLRKKNVASEAEWEEAKAEAELAAIKIEKARQDQRQARLKMERQQLRIEEMTLVSKIDGIVEKVDLHVGETADPTKPAVTIVKNDPLWVELYLPTAASRQLKIGQELPVRYANDAAAPLRSGRIIFMSPLADAGADRQLVRLEMDNKPSGDQPAMAAGLRVLVDVPPAAPPKAAAARE